MPMQMEIESQMDSCFTRARDLAAGMAQFAIRAGADNEEAAKAHAMAMSLLPLLLWMMDGKELACNALAMDELSQLGEHGSGIGQWSLIRRDIPSDIRDPVFPMLRPDRHERFVDWWDEVARPRWLRPFLRELEADGNFQAMVALPAWPPDPKSVETWRREYDLAWRNQAHAN